MRHRPAIPREIRTSERLLTMTSKEEALRRRENARQWCEFWAKHLPNNWQVRHAEGRSYTYWRDRYAALCERKD